MTNRRIVPIIAALGIMTFAGCRTPTTAPKNPRAMVVVPARHIAVKMAQDVASLRNNVFLVTYRGKQNDENPELYFWAEQRWHPISIDDFAQPGNYKQPPELVMIYASGTHIPSVIIEGASWSENIHFVDSLDVGKMLTTYNEQFAFSEGEFKAIAKRYDIIVEDRNYDRRKYGRYGPPGTSPNQPAPPSSLSTPEEDGAIAPIPLGE